MSVENYQKFMRQQAAKQFAEALERSLAGESIVPLSLAERQRQRRIAAAEFEQARQWKS